MKILPSNQTQEKVRNKGEYRLLAGRCFDERVRTHVFHQCCQPPQSGRLRLAASKAAKRSKHLICIIDDMRVIGTDAAGK